MADGTINIRPIGTIFPITSGRIIGIPVPPQPGLAGQSNIFQTAIRPPNLSDASVRGIYNAATRVPSSAIETLNRVSTRIGAPALSGGNVASVQHMPSGGGGDPRPLVGQLPAVARAGIARARVLANTLTANLRNFPRRY